MAGHTLLLSAGMPSVVPGCFFFFSFCMGVLNPLCIHYQLQLRWGHHIPTNSLWVLRTEDSGWLLISNNFSPMAGFGTHTCKHCRRKKKPIPKGIVFLHSNHSAFLQCFAKSILGARLWLLTFLLGQNRQLWYTILYIVSNPKIEEKGIRWVGQTNKGKEGRGKLNLSHVLKSWV